MGSLLSTDKRRLSAAPFPNLGGRDRGVQGKSAQLPSCVSNNLSGGQGVQIRSRAATTAADTLVLYVYLFLPSADGRMGCGQQRVFLPRKFTGMTSIWKREEDMEKAALAGGTSPFVDLFPLPKDGDWLPRDSIDIIQLSNGGQNRCRCGPIDRAMTFVVTVPVLRLSPDGGSVVCFFSHSFPVGFCH